MNESKREKTSPLPPLRKKRRSDEVDITPAVMEWLTNNYPRSCEFEIKVGKNVLLPHQKVVLQKVVDGTYIQKHPDLGHRTGLDGHFMKDADALVIRCKGRTCVVTVMNTGEQFNIQV